MNKTVPEWTGVHSNQQQVKALSAHREIAQEIMVGEWQASMDNNGFGFVPTLNMI
jgi:hypothetical protein